MTPSRLEELAMRVRDVQPNNPDAAGMSAWLPARPYLIAENGKYNVCPVHGADGIVWRLVDSDGKIVKEAATFCEAVEGVPL